MHFNCDPTCKHLKYSKEKLATFLGVFPRCASTLKKANKVVNHTDKGHASGRQPSLCGLVVSNGPQLSVCSKASEPVKGLNAFYSYSFCHSGISEKHFLETFFTLNLFVASIPPLSGKESLVVQG